MDALPPYQGNLMHWAKVNSCAKLVIWVKLFPSLSFYCWAIEACFQNIATVYLLFGRETISSTFFLITSFVWIFNARNTDLTCLSGAGQTVVSPFGWLFLPAAPFACALLLRFSKPCHDACSRTVPPGQSQPFHSSISGLVYRLGRR